MRKCILGIFIIQQKCFEILESAVYATFYGSDGR